MCQQTAACRQEWRTRRRAVDGDAIRESRRRQYAANPETERERARQWAAANPEAVREKSRRHARKKRAENPEAVRESSRKWRAANLETAREAERRYDRQRIQRDDLPCRYSKYGCTDLKIRNSRFCRKHAGIHREQRRKRRRNDASRRHAEAQGWTCTWCALALSASLDDTHQDHVIPKAATMAALGRIIEDDWNIDVLHAVCNIIKGDSLTSRAIALAAERGIDLPRQEVGVCPTRTQSNDVAPSGSS